MRFKVRTDWTAWYLGFHFDIPAKCSPDQRRSFYTSIGPWHLSWKTNDEEREMKEFFNESFEKVRPLLQQRAMDEFRGLR